MDTKTLSDKNLNWWSNHWLTTINLFFLIYAGLPILAPILLGMGHQQIAHSIYWVYSYLCNQLPSHSYFIMGAQVAICQRCLAMHGMMLLFGLVYGLMRHRVRPLNLRWYLLFLIPLGLDGGMQFVSELVKVAPFLLYPLWGISLFIIAILVIMLRRVITWQGLLFLGAGPLALVYIQLFGFYESDWFRRTLTGVIYALGTVWFVYPQLEEGSTSLNPRRP